MSLAAGLDGGERGRGCRQGGQASGAERLLFIWEGKRSVSGRAL